MAVITGNGKPVVVTWNDDTCPTVNVACGRLVIRGAAATTATWVAAPLVPPYDVTIAVRFPKAGAVANVTSKPFLVDDVTVPTAPALNTTELADAVVEKLSPAINSIPPGSTRKLVLLTTEGAATMVAT